MNRNSVPARYRTNYAEAQRRVAQQQYEASMIPRGAQQGAIAGPPVPQAYGYAPAAQGYGQPPMPVPQGADAGALAGCGGPWGPGACGPIPNLFAGWPSTPLWSWIQECSLLGIVVTPLTTGATTLEICCNGAIYQGIGGRSFNDPNTYAFNSISSGFSSLNLICPEGAVDVAFFQTDQCFCPFDFGCFWCGAPLVISFSPITTASTLPPFNFVVVGRKYETNACFPPPFWGPGAPGPGNFAASPGGPPMIPSSAPSGM